MHDEELLRRYLTGSLPGEEMEDVELRLLADDGFFELAEAIEREVLADLARSGLDPLDPRVASDLGRRLAASAGGRARLDLAQSLTTLSRQADIPGDLAHLEGRALCEALLERGWSLRTESPRETVRLTRLAFDLASRLDADLRGRIATELANVYRFTEQPREAEKWLAEADTLLAQGSGDRALAARLLATRGTLLADLRRFQEAFTSLDAASAIYRELGDDHESGWVLMIKARCAGFADDVETSVRLIQQALSLIDAAKAPRLVLAAVHNLARYMIHDGQYAEARALLEENLWRYEAHGHAVDRLKLRWLLGKISAGTGDLDQAERDLTAAWEGLVAASLPYTAAIAALDLGQVHLQQGRIGEARRLVREAVEVFRALDINREALAALLFLEKTFELETATAGTLVSVADFLVRAENDPEAKFTLP